MKDVEHIRSLVNKLTESDFDDLGLRGHGSELDRDSNDMGKDYAKPMVQQLGKVLDSRGNENPIDSVETKDGSQIKVTMDQAATLLMLLKLSPVNGMDRQNHEKFRDDIQTKAGLVPFLDANDGKSIQMLYLEKYGQERLKVMRQGGNRI